MTELEFQNYLREKGIILTEKQVKQFQRYYDLWKNGNITAKKCMDELGLKRATFYKLVNRYESELSEKT